ncbi:hypothetical protein HZS_6919 [Henneguya salminicola]|nr:hypothetical protein HZS_6919 [Henneguya salminicola]
MCVSYAARRVRHFRVKLCCDCGVLIEPNSANMCVSCIRRVSDITEGIKRNLSIYYCKFCQRFLNPPDTWLKYELESRELLTMCLKKLNNFNHVRLVDAKFLWTEPHSYALIIQITIQKEVFGLILEECINIDVKIFKQMCTNCHKVEANDFYRAIVQVRQKVHEILHVNKARHKKTLYFLEQVILKHKASNDCCKIEIEKDGMDFCFRTPQHAHKFVDFINCFVPCVHKESQELISHDTHNNIYNYKYTTLLTIVPICKDDVICISRKYAKSLGLANSILICYRVTKLIYLIDPLTLQSFDIFIMLAVALSAKEYFRQPFPGICNMAQFVKYMIVDVENIDKYFPSSAHRNKFSLVDVTVMREDIGSDGTFIVKSHLGNNIKPGQYALGFDLKHSNVNNEEFDDLDASKLPDAILIKRFYGDKKERRNYRRWKLRRLKQESRASATDSTAGMDYEEFLDDIEEDSENRKNIDIFISEENRNIHQNLVDRGLQSIPLHDMISDLYIS